jgi:hypothetical protein
MRTLRRISTASALVFTLALSTFAGEITTGIAPQPAPTPATAEGEMSTPLNGDISTTNSEEAVGGDAVAAALSVVECVLSFL